MPTLSIPVPNPPDILYRQSNQSAEPAAADPTTDPVAGSNALGPSSATIVPTGDSGHPEEVSNLSPSPAPTESMRPTEERRYLQTDVGNADRLVDAYGADLLYCPEHLTYMVWTGQRWVPDHDSHLVEALAENTLRRMFAEAGGFEDKESRSGFLRFVNASLSRKGICNMCYSARRKAKAKKLPQFDSKCNLLNFVNGTVDLRTGRLQRHSRADLITKMIPFAYNPRATCPHFQESLTRILPDPQLREFVQMRIPMMWMVGSDVM
jgi:phage/plasmid-associated DNA primase